MKNEHVYTPEKFIEREKIGKLTDYQYDYEDVKFKSSYNEDIIILKYPKALIFTQKNDLKVILSSIKYKKECLIPKENKDMISFLKDDLSEWIISNDLIDIFDNILFFKNQILDSLKSLFSKLKNIKNIKKNFEDFVFKNSYDNSSYAEEFLKFYDKDFIFSFRVLCEHLHFYDNLKSIKQNIEGKKIKPNKSQTEKINKINELLSKPKKVNTESNTTKVISKEETVAKVDACLKEKNNNNDIQSSEETLSSKPNSIKDIEVFEKKLEKRDEKRNIEEFNINNPKSGESMYKLLEEYIEKTKFITKEELIQLFMKSLKEPNYFIEDIESICELFQASIYDYIAEQNKPKTNKPKISPECITQTFTLKEIVDLFEKKLELSEKYDENFDLGNVDFVKYLTKLFTDYNIKFEEDLNKKCAKKLEEIEKLVGKLKN